jgi:hypothetical protein
MQREGSQLTLEMGQCRLLELREAIQDIRNGGGDYSIGGDGPSLLVWWWLE